MKKTSYLYTIVATGFGLGYSPIAPGTVGSLGAVLGYYLLQSSCPFLSSFFTGLIGLSIVFVIGLVSAATLEQQLGKDPSCVVIDEVVGMWIALWCLPINGFTLLLAFIGFRFFDILKPLGIGYLDKNLPGAWGIMADDVLAGIYTNLLLQLYIYCQLPIAFS